MAISRFKTSTLAQGLPKYTELWDQTTSIPQGFYSIASGVVDSGESATITFSSIPAIYKHLQLRISARSSYSYSVDDAYLQLNGDTGNNYGSHNYFGGSPQSSSVQVNQSTTTDKINWGQAGGMGTTAVGQWGLCVIDILDYAGTSIKKSIRTTSGMSTDSQPSAAIGGRVGNAVGTWNSTAAVNQITLLSVSGRPFNQYSSFALYGIV
jgi:hypothetical protein